MLPDYMVHQPLTKKTVDANDCKFSPEKLPYAFDQKTAYEREGNRSIYIFRWKISEQRHFIVIN